MTGNGAHDLRLIARLVIAISIMLVIAGVVWHGVSIGVFQRIWHDLIERPSGPMSFRFWREAAGRDS